jgi:hypothetical protein
MGIKVGTNHHKCQYHTYYPRSVTTNDKYAYSYGSSVFSEKTTDNSSVVASLLRVMIGRAV